jgi:hypothetical protein
MVSYVRNFCNDCVKEYMDTEIGLEKREQVFRFVRKIGRQRELLGRSPDLDMEHVVGANMVISTFEMFTQLQPPELQHLRSSVP